MKLKKAIENLMPGLFLFGFCIGTGSVTSMAKAGTEHGMALLWTLVVACAITFFLIHKYGEFTLITGRTALQAIREEIHPGVALLCIVGLGVNMCGSVMGVMGVVADVSVVWTEQYLPWAVPAVVLAAGYTGLVLGLFWVGRMEVFEKALALMVAVMAMAFLGNFLMLMPPVGELAEGLVPRMPEREAGENPFILIPSMVGTTVFSGLFLMRGSQVRARGWTLAERTVQRNDALVSACCMFLVSAAVMGSAAGTLHGTGVELTETAQMVTVLRPIAGDFSIHLMVLGILAAGLSSQFPNLILVPWLAFDYLGKPLAMQRGWVRIFVVLLGMMGLVVPVFHARPILVLVASQALGALMLPVTTGCMFYLGNRRDLMGANRYGWGTNAVFGAILLFALGTMGLGLRGFWEMAQKL